MSSGPVTPDPQNSETVPASENAAPQPLTPESDTGATGNESTVGAPAESGSAPTETPGTDQPAAAPASSAPTPQVEAPPSPVVEESAQPADLPAAKPRVQLNPVKDLTQLRAVGSVEAVETPELIPAAGEAPVPLPPKPTGPVEIPDVDELDSDIEAQINAAMSTPPDAAPAVVADADGADAEVAAAPTLDDTGLPVEGSRLSGTVQSIHEDNVFLDVGLRISAVVALRQFPSDKPPAVGDTVQVVTEGTDDDESLILTNLPSGARKISGNWDDLAEGQVVDCLVTKTNKGGLAVTVSNLRGFLPASQIDLGYVEDTEVYVGQKLRVRVTEVNKKKRNLVVSRRALLQEERDAAGEEFWQSIEEGATFTGTVKTLKDYGAFVNIGPVDGFLHIGEISWSRVSHPRDVLAEGQTIEVKVLKIDQEKKRIGLGMRQLSQNPWLLATEKYAAGRTVSGKVTRVADFGAFVELEPGIEGLVHISELAWKRVGSVSEILSVGQTEDFKVLEVDPNRKRIGLSLKQTQEKPEAPKSESRSDSAADSAPPPRRTSPKNLLGGTGEAKSGGGGLFGNPADFS